MSVVYRKEYKRAIDFLTGQVLRPDLQAGHKVGVSEMSDDKGSLGGQAGRSERSGWVSIFHSCRLCS